MKKILYILVFMAVIFQTINILAADNRTGVSALSDKDKDSLLGAWQGKLDGVLTIVFRFEMTQKGDFVGFLDSPDQGSYGIPVSDIGVTDDTLAINIPAIGGEYKGKISGNEMVGDFKQLGRTTPLSMKKGQYKTEVYKLNLPMDVMDQLLGKWTGKLGPINLVFRFEKTKENGFVGFIDSPDQGAKGIPIMDANISGGNLILNVRSLDGVFKGKISNDKLDGDWTQAGMKNPLSLTKEKP
jgi:hypothetical protein